MTRISIFRPLRKPGWKRQYWNHWLITYPPDKLTSIVGAVSAERSRNVNVKGQERMRLEPKDDAIEINRVRTDLP